MNRYGLLLKPSLRADWLFQQPVSVLVVETGANDGLRGLPPDSLRANIQAIFDRAKRLRPPPRLVLLGMRVPPNYGLPYSQQFRSLYPEVAFALDWLSQFGPARMTGTGACVFADFADRAAAQSVLTQIPANYRGFVAMGVNVSPVHAALGLTAT